MISDNPEFEAFIDECRWATITTLRKSGSPVSSIVAYARDGDDIVVSTPGFTFKKKSLENDPRVNLCIFNNQEPFNFVAIEGKATVETEDLVRVTELVFDNIADTGYQKPPEFEQWLESQQRVILRIKADRIYGVIR